MLCKNGNFHYIFYRDFFEKILIGIRCPPINSFNDTYCNMLYCNVTYNVTLQFYCITMLLCYNVTMKYYNGILYFDIITMLIS